MKNKILYGITGISILLLMICISGVCESENPIPSLIGVGVSLIWLIPFMTINRNKVVM